VLRSFADKDTERVWRRERSRRLDQHTKRAALRKLLILDAAETSTTRGSRRVTDWRSSVETVPGNTASE
jgi:plasmid maintenance system killer protein